MPRGFGGQPDLPRGLRTYYRLLDFPITLEALDTHEHTFVATVVGLGMRCNTHVLRAPSHAKHYTQTTPAEEMKGVVAGAPRRLNIALVEISLILGTVCGKNELGLISTQHLVEPCLCRAR